MTRPAATKGSKRRPPLDTERAIEAAFAVLARHGFDGLTVRRIAERLAVQNPALYWHFKNKQAIVDRMAERLLTEVANAAIADSEGANWRELLLALACSFRRVLLSYTDGARLVAAASLARSPLAPLLAAAFGKLVDAGFSERDALTGIITVLDFTLGATFEEQEDPVRTAKPRRRAATPAAGDDPWLAAVARLAPSLGDRATVFAGGLDLVLAGLAACAQAPAAPGRRGRKRS